MKYLKYIIPIVVGLIVIGGTALAAQKALPGSSLYGIKKEEEKIQLSLAFSPVSKAQIQASQAEERLNELAKMGVSTQTTANVMVPNSNLTKNPFGQGTPQTAVNVQAALEARTEVTNAILALNQAKTNLQASGDVKNLAAINQILADLQTKAQAENIVPTALVPAPGYPGLTHGSSEVPVVSTSTYGSAGSASGGIGSSGPGKIVNMNDLPPAQSPGPVTDLNNITPNNNFQTVKIKVGQSFTVNLGTGWTAIESSNSGVVEQTTSANASSATTFKAVGTGTTELSATKGPTCKGCMMATFLFQLKVEVTQ